MEQPWEDQTDRRATEARRRARGVGLTAQAIDRLRSGLHARWEEIGKDRPRPTRADTAEMLGVSAKTADRILAGQRVDRNTLIYAFRSVGLDWEDAYCDSLPSSPAPEHALEAVAQTGPSGPPASRSPRPVWVLISITAAIVLGIALAYRPFAEMRWLAANEWRRDELERENFRISQAATAEFQSGNYRAAQAHLVTTTRLSQELGVQHVEIELRNSADVAEATGDLAKARRQFEQLRTLRASQGDEVYLPALDEALGDLDTRSGDLTLAKSELHVGLKGYWRYREADGVAMCLRDLGTIATLEGRLGDAEANFREALACIRGSKAADMERDIEARQAMLWARQGRADEARLVLNSCLAYWTQRKHRRWIATTTQQLALLENSVGHTQAANRLFEEAAAGFTGVGDRFGEQQCARALRSQTHGS